MRYLRQSTATTVLVGPFVAKGDAVTPVTTLTTGSTLNGRAVSNGTGAAYAPATLAHDANGYYLAALAIADVPSVGRLRLEFSDPATYLPVWEDFSVLSTAVYDWMFGATAPNTTTPPTVVAIRTELDSNSTKLVYLDAAVTSRLAPTVAGHTLDVSSTGEAGIDWANIGTPDSAVALSATTVGAVTGSVGRLGSQALTDLQTAVWASASRTLTSFAFSPVVSGFAGGLVPANWSALLISAGGLVAIDTAKTFPVRNQDGVTIPTLADAFQGAWTDPFAAEQESDTGATYVKQLPDKSGPARTFTLAEDVGGNPVGRS